ncbi:peroxiredoxin [Rhodocytophaga rosea]|uniref:Thioredoxin peroxidase n=1 Tax=Rhodocytophaga rosea TaxID=2704465 RepID=A0A6C0GT07_9BACT|nr:peroxiredoxin [Rhodocytophaga rosea]QHT71301.1 peroxiredoxin [Rhodocytophaga rosea]
MNTMYKTHTEPAHLRIGHPAPPFEVDSTLGPVKLSDYAGKWLVLFSYPADFTPVCTSEVISFAGIQPVLKELNCELLGVSVDSVYEHRNWLKHIEESSGVSVDFPIIADLNLEVAGKYALLANENAEEALRSLFVIDPMQRIRAIIQYPASTGRNIDEVIRLVKALQVADTGVITPAGWQPGEAVINPGGYRVKK